MFSDLTARQYADAEHLVLNRRGDLISASNIAFDLVQAQTLLTPETYSDPLYLDDLDSFKPYNDNYGHETGDKALQKIADYLKKHSEQGKVYRYGGEELAVILPKSLLVKQPDYVDQLHSECLSWLA